MKRVTLFIAAAWVMSLCGVTLAQDRGAASSIAWSPDGETIAVGSTTGLWFFDNEFNHRGFVEVELGMSGWPKFVDWNSTGDYVVFANMLTNPISIVDVRKFNVITEIDKAIPWVQIRWHPKANHIVNGAPGSTRIFDAITGEELYNYNLPEEELHLGNFESLGFCWYRENTLIIVHTQRILVVDPAEKTLLQSIDSALFTSRPVDCNREHQILSIHGRLFDLETAAFTWIPDRSFLSEDGFSHSKSVAVAWSPDSNHFVANLTGCLVRVFDGRTGKVVAGIPGGVGGLGPSIYFFIDSIAWHPDGSRFAVVGQFGDIRVWNAETFELLQRFDGFELHPDVLAYLTESGTLSESRCP